MIQFDKYFIVTTANICVADCKQHQGQNFHETHHSLCVYHRQQQQ